LVERYKTGSDLTRQKKEKTMPETGLTKNKLIAELSRSSHGKLDDYVAVGKQAAAQEPEFLAHLIAWDRLKGQVRDAKVALPVVSLSVPYPDELAENSLAHMAMLGPREMLRAYRFALQLKIPGHMRQFRRLVGAWLRENEKDWRDWQRLGVQHRATLHELYALAHVTRPTRIGAVLFRGERKPEGGTARVPLPPGSIFETVAHLKDMSAQEAAGTIMNKKIPFLIAMGALGTKAKEPDLVLALINRMSSTELITNTKMLERLGVKTNPALKGAFEKGLEKAAQSKKNVLKTSRAADAIGDETLKTKLRGVQDKQLASMGVEGNWLVLGDKSGSMEHAIDVAKHVAAVLAKMVKGKVWLVFFDTVPQTIDVTGMPLDVIQNVTRFVSANGGTSIGCGLQRMLESKEELDGIAIVSDAQENTAPYFADAYKKYSEAFSKEVPVYLYRVGNQSNFYADKDLKKSMNALGFDLQEFDVPAGLDFYSLPNLVTTMRTNRYSLVDEVMASKLLRLSDVLKTQEVLVHA